MGDDHEAGRSYIGSFLIQVSNGGSLQEPFVRNASGQRILVPQVWTWTVLPDFIVLFTSMKRVSGSGSADLWHGSSQMRTLLRPRFQVFFLVAHDKSISRELGVMNKRDGFPHASQDPLCHA